MSDLLDQLFTKPQMYPVLSNEKEYPWRNNVIKNNASRVRYLLLEFPHLRDKIIKYHEFNSELNGLILILNVIEIFNINQF